MIEDDSIRGARAEAEVWRRAIDRECELIGIPAGNGIGGVVALRKLIETLRTENLQLALCIDRVGQEVDLDRPVQIIREAEEEGRLTHERLEDGTLRAVIVPSAC